MRQHLWTSGYVFHNLLTPSGSDHPGTAVSALSQQRLLQGLSTTPKSKKRKCEVADKQIWRHLGGYNKEQKRKSQERNKQKRHPQYARMECSTDNKPNQACEWVILGRESSPLCLRPVHFDIYIAKIFSWRQAVDLSEVNGIAALMPEVNLAPKGLFYAMI